MMRATRPLVRQWPRRQPLVMRRVRWAAWSHAIASRYVAGEGRHHAAPLLHRLARAGITTVRLATASNHYRPVLRLTARLSLSFSTTVHRETAATAAVMAAALRPADASRVLPLTARPATAHTAAVVTNRGLWNGRGDAIGRPGIVLHHHLAAAARPADVSVPAQPRTPAPPIVLHRAAPGTAALRPGRDAMEDTPATRPGSLAGRTGEAAWPAVATAGHQPPRPTDDPVAVERIADQVMRQIDRRLLAYRERTGRV